MKMPTSMAKSYQPQCDHFAKLTPGSFLKKLNAIGTDNIGDRFSKCSKKGSTARLWQAGRDDIKS
jgi:hypothetical protein